MATPSYKEHQQEVTHRYKGRFFKSQESPLTCDSTSYQFQQQTVQRRCYFSSHCYNSDTGTSKELNMNDHRRVNVDYLGSHRTSGAEITKLPVPGLTLCPFCHTMQGFDHKTNH